MTNRSSGLWLRGLAAQTAMELRLAGRRGENLLVTFVIPVGLLLFVGNTPLLAGLGEHPFDYLVPGIVALAIISSSLVSLGIATAYERHYAVLKRLGATPLGRGRLLLAKALATLVIVLVQTALVLAVSRWALNWWPPGGVVGLVLPVTVGTLTFGAIGLLLAGTLRAEATLALANGLYLLLMLTGGFLLPLSHLPGPLATLAGWLPAAPLADWLRQASTGGTVSAASVLIVTIWGFVAALLARRFFRWE